MAETFGAELRRLREAAGLTLRALGHEAQLSASFLCDLEHERRTPTDRVVAVIGPLIAKRLSDGVERRWGAQYLRELAFKARGECCPRCGFGGEEERMFTCQRCGKHRTIAVWACLDDDCPCCLECCPCKDCLKRRMS